MGARSFFMLLLLSLIVSVTVDWRGSYLFGASSLSFREGLVILALLGLLNGTIIIDLLEYRGQSEVRRRSMPFLLFVILVDIATFKEMYFR